MRTLSDHQSEHLTNTLRTSANYIQGIHPANIFKWVKPKYEQYEESGSTHRIIKATKLI